MVKLIQEHMNVLIVTAILFFLTLWVIVNSPGEFKAGLVYFLIGVVVFVGYATLGKKKGR